MRDRALLEAELQSRGYRLIDLPDDITPYATVLDWECHGLTVAWRSARYFYSLGQIANLLRRNAA